MEKTITTADGRVLCLEVAGDPDGPVIVYHHGTPMSRLLFSAHVADVETKARASSVTTGQAMGGRRDIRAALSQM